MKDRTDGRAVYWSARNKCLHQLSDIGSEWSSLFKYEYVALKGPCEWRGTLEDAVNNTSGSGVVNPHRWDSLGLPKMFGFSTRDKSRGCQYGVSGSGLSSAGEGVSRLDVRAGSCLSGMTSVSGAATR